MANAIVRLPLGYFPDPDKGRPLSNAKIYIGIVDLNPRIVVNQLTVTGRQEDGTEVSVAQPIRTSSGGIPVDDNGNIVTLLVDGAHAMAVDDKGDSQKYFFDNVLDGAPVVFTDNPVLFRDTVAIAVADIKLVIGQYIQTKGRLTVNDGGGWDYIVSTSTGTDDGGLRIDMTSGLQLQAIQKSIYPVQIWGAIGDGTTVVDSALINAIQSGMDLDFGGPENIYRVTTSIDVTIIDDCSLVSNGATINYDGAAGLVNILDFELNGNSFYLEGDLKILGNANAQVGIKVLNTSDTFVNIYVNNLKIFNLRKSLFTDNAEGMDIRGAYNSVIFNNITVDTVVMATGTGNSGISGVAGITIRALGNTRFPKFVNVNNPIITDIYAEDTTYTSDQDGVRVFGPEDVIGEFFPDEQHAQITGGKYKNCMGRSVKTQNQKTTVRGLEIVRERGLAGTAPWGVEIDLQTGGGFVSDITCTYLNETLPLTVCVLSTPQLDGKIVPHGSVDGIHVFTDATISDPLDEVVRITARNITDALKINIRNIDVIGNVNQVVKLNPANITPEIGVNLTDAHAAPLISLVAAAASSGQGRVNISNCFYTGSATIPIYSTTSSSQEYYISAEGCHGWESAKSINSFGQQGNFTRINAFTANDVEKSGLFRPVVFTLNDTEQFQFPESAVNGHTNMLIISVGASRNDQGIFASDEAQVNILAAGSNFQVGTTTEPVSGNYRLWTGSLGPLISNHSGGTKVFTCMMIG